MEMKRKKMCFLLAFTMMASLLMVTPVTVSAGEALVDLHPSLCVSLDDSGKYWSSWAGDSSNATLLWTGGTLTRSNPDPAANPATNILIDARSTALINMNPTGDPATIDVPPSTDGKERGASRHRFGVVKFDLSQTVPGETKTYREMIVDGEFKSVKISMTPTGEHLPASTYALYTLTPELLANLDDDTELTNYGTARELGYTAYNQNAMLVTPAGIEKDKAYVSDDKAADLADYINSQTSEFAKNAIGFVVTVPNKNLGRIKNLKLTFEREDTRTNSEFNVTVGNGTSFDQAKLTVSGTYASDTIALKFTSGGTSKTVTTRSATQGISNAEEISATVPVVEGNDDSYDVEVTITNVLGVQLYQNTFNGLNYRTTRVVFNGNGGGADHVPDPYSAVEQGAVIAKPADPDRPNYEFAGWFTEPEAVNEWNFATETVTYSKTTNGVLNLYAGWNVAATQYTITYDANGGVGSVEDAHVFGGSAAYLANRSGLTKEGCSFMGWNTQADGLGTHYGAGESIMMSGDLNLFAEWEAVTAAGQTIERIFGGTYEARAQEAAYDNVGNLYVTSREGTQPTDNVIRKISPDGTVSILVGTPYNSSDAKPSSADADWGTGADFYIAKPWGITFDADQNLYFAEYGTNTAPEPPKIRMLTNENPDKTGEAVFDETSTMTTLYEAAPDNNNRVCSLVFDRDNNLNFIEANRAVKRLNNANPDKTGTPDFSAYYPGADEPAAPQRIAGDGTVQYSDTERNPLEAKFNAPHGLTARSNGNLYVASSNDGRIFEISDPGTPEAKMRTVVGGFTGSTSSTRDVAFREGTLYDLNPSTYPTANQNFALAYDKVNDVIYGACANNGKRINVLDFAQNKFYTLAGGGSTAVTATNNVPVKSASIAMTPNGIAVNKWGDVAITWNGGNGANCEINLVTRRASVTYNAGGIDVALPAAVTGRAGQKTVIADLTNPATSSVSFLGWNTKQDGTGAAVAAGTEWTFGRNDLALYAVWSGGVFNQNGDQLTFANLGEATQIVLGDSTDTSIVPYVALYDDKNRLLKVVSAASVSTSEGNVVIALNNPIGDVLNAAYAKILVWRDLTTLAPTDYIFTLR